MKGVVGQALRLSNRLKHGKPQKDLRNDRQETHERAERKVTAIDQAFFQGNAQDHPPTGDAISAFG